jgi:hypothetical protein
VSRRLAALRWLFPRIGANEPSAGELSRPCNGARVNTGRRTFKAV